MHLQTPLELTSIGKAASIVQRHPARIRAAAEQLGIAPVLIVNGVAHFDVESIERIHAHLAKSNPTD